MSQTMSAEEVRLIEKRAYIKGYQNRGVRWPEHRPPEPPNDIVAGMMLAMKALRDEVDAFIATLEETDELVLSLGPKIDDVDASLSRVSAWLVRQD